MANNDFIKNITSKDFELSLNTIKNLISSKNLTLFSQLCEKADYIFPFIKERITNNFLDLIKRENLDTIFEFSKIYSYDFEDIIVTSWLNFANEDLTDDILSLFENGTQEQKAYCAKYFSRINDSLALDLLTQYAKSEFEPLRTNCAIALKAFGYKKITDDMKYIIENDSDEFKVLNSFQFLIAYKDESLIKYIIKKARSNPFELNIVTYLKSFYPLDILKKHLSINETARIFSIICENYPENISLDTIFQYEILDFIKFLNLKENYNQYIENIFILCKNRFVEFSENEIYNYDLDKNTKTELEKTVKYLSGIEFKLENFKDELFTYSNQKYRFSCALEVVKELNLKQYGEFLSSLINENKLDYTLMSETAIALKNTGEQNLIDKTKIEQIENENIKAFILSLL